MRLIVLLSIIFLQPFFTIAQQEIVFNHLNVSNGLSQNSILAIAQDSEGLMWFGTRYCLNKYDSKEFTIYKNKPGSKESISSNEFVQAIYRDKHQRLWIGTRKGLNLYQPRYDNYIQFLHEGNRQSISDDYINCIYDDDFGNLWVGTQNGLSLLKDLKNGTFQSSFQTVRGKISFEGYAIHTIFQDSQRTLWLGTNKGLFEFRQQGNGYFSLKKFAPAKGTKTINDDFITSLAEDRNKNLWIGTRSGGLNCLDLNSRIVKHFVHKASDKSTIINNFIRKIVIDKNGKLWIGTQEGLSIFDTHTYKAVSYVHDPSDPGSLSQNSIYDICIDSQGSIWIGTYFGGINVVYNYATPFNIWQNNKYQSSLSSNIVSSIIEDKNHNLWIGTEASGLNYYNKKTGLFTHYKNDLNDPGSLSSNLVKWIYEDNSHQIWIATHLNGLDLFDPSTTSFKHYVHTGDTNSISSNNVSCLLEDSQKRFWVGTEKGLNLLDKRSGKFMSVNGQKSHSVNYLFEDSKKNIWAATNKGVLKLAHNSTRFKPFELKDLHNNYLKTNCIFEDSKGRMWFGIFHGGLVQYDPRSGKKRLYTEDDGLPSNNVLEILEENKDLLWISSDKGLTRFDCERLIFNNYDEHDGLPGTEFNNNSKLKDSKGNLYFGSYNGLVSFAPKRISLNTLAPKIVFTDLKLFNKTIGINDSTNILKQNLNFTRSINLKYDQNVFTISFALLNYIKTSKNSFAYLLKGIDKDWNYTKAGFAAYSGLPAGTYTLLVKGANNDGVWCKEPAQIKISIHPPFWRTTWAYVVYLLLSIAVLYYVIRFFRERAKLERDLYHEHLQYERQQELYQLKLNFFTKISHEIRTPLTLILGPIERLLFLTKDTPAVYPYMENIKKNGDRLLRLVSELLDFRKIESGKMQLNVSEQDLVAFSSEIFSSFQHLARSKNIEYRFNCEEANIILFMDNRQLEKVFYNILSNAFKFTPDGGQIIFKITLLDQSAHISITDNGVGIPEADQVKVFDDFYQVENAKSYTTGSGIGLTLAKEIVLLHGGTINVISTPATNNGNGHTQFSVILPLTAAGIEQNTELAPQVLEENYQDYPQKENEAGLRSQPILIVEDNDEMREFIADTLKGTYPLLQSANGSDGLENAIKHMPDLIISDVMMPVMDGLEFCRKIKSDERTSHIPVLLLTARDAHVHYIEGFSTGADAYITKPFSSQALKLQIDNLLRLKEALQMKYSRQLVLETSNIVIESAEEKFLDRIVKIVEANIGNADFNISKLAAEIGMSQAVLYKKFSALTNMALADFIKSQRLKQASILLKSGKCSIAEIAYAVGYNDRKYFSKEFRKNFGLSPSQYLSKHAPESDSVQPTSPPEENTPISREISSPALE